MNPLFLISFFFLVFGAQLALAAEELPQKFLGSWKVAESKNFDEFLVAKGFGWLMRQLILHSPVTKVFEKNMKTPDTYNAFIITPTKDARWYGWTLGTPFIGTYVDDKKHTITFDYDSETDTFIETHDDLEKPNEPTDVIKYNVNKGRLEMTVEYNKVQAVRYYDNKPN